MSISTLDARSRDVLKTLIQIHVLTGEPVGSESLSRAMGRALSPATLRNIMAELERLGYLDHPHTSAGRMPTDEGYRFYVDALLRHTPLPPGAAAAIESELRPQDGSTQQVLENASHVLSRLSRQVGFVLAPDLGRATFRHIDLVRLPPPRVLVVMVSHAALVTSKVIELEEALSPETLQACANYLNAHFAGMTLSAIRAHLLELMREEKALYDSLLRSVLSVGERAFAAEEEGGRVFIDGTANMLESAGIEDLDRMRVLFKTFEERSRLVKILNACLSGDGLRIVIGHENPDPDLRDLSLVATSCMLDGEADLGLGVMGSTRMEYARVIALVDQVARSASRVLREMRG
jgi:heat-inducible transcriptional repressor